jgi:WD40 repeat protein
MHEVQIWDFRKGSILVRKELGGQHATLGSGSSYIRFTNDGALLAVYTGGNIIRVLRSVDLQQIRLIHIELPPPSSSMREAPVGFDDKETRVTSFETSPKGHFVALRLYRGTRVRRLGPLGKPLYLGGFVSIYDLDSDAKINGWEISSGYLEGGNGLAWRGDGRQLAAAASDAIPCYRGGGTIFLLGPGSSGILHKFRVSSLVGDIAWGDEDHIYVANESCPGHFSDQAPDLPVFSASTGKRIGAFRSPSGIRHRIAVSADKRRLIGYVGREKMTFAGLEDTIVRVDSRFEVWDLETGKALFTSPDLGPPTPLPPTLRFSASGDLALFAGFQGDVRIFPIDSSGY